MSYRIKVIGVTVAAVLGLALTAAALTSSELVFKDPVPLTADGIPVAAVRVINKAYAGEPELQEAARMFVMTRLDEVLTAAQSNRFDPVRAERSQAGLFCVAARARRLGIPFGGSEAAQLDGAVRAAFPEEFKVAQSLAQGRPFPVRTHEHQACGQVGLMT